MNQPRGKGSPLQKTPSSSGFKKRSFIVFGRFFHSLLMPAFWGVTISACYDGDRRSTSQQITETSAVSTFYSPKIGQEKRCTIKAKGDVNVDYGLAANVMNPQAKLAQDKGMTHHRFNVETELHTRVLGKEDGNFLIAMRLKNHHAKIDQDEEQRTRAFETPFLVHMNGTGAIVKYEFARMFPKDVRRRIRGLVESLQIVGPARSDAMTWESTEHTAEGTQRVSYAIEKQKSKNLVLKRTLLSSNDSSQLFNRSNLARRSTRITHSQGTVVWAADGSGLKQLTLNEAMSGKVGHRALDRQQNAMAVTCSAEIDASLPSTIEAARKALENETFIQASFYRVPMDRLEKIKDLRFDNMVNRFNEGFASKRQADAVADTKYWLRLHPNSTSQFIETLTDLEMTKETSLKMAHGFAAVGAAGHIEAQKAIIDIIQDRQFDPKIRNLAVRGTLNIQRPERELVDAVWRYRESLPEPTTAHDRVIRSMTTAIYGSLGSAAFKNPELSKEVVDNLSTSLIAARNIQERIDVLTALGNVGDLSLTLPHSESYFYSDNWKLRGYAFKTFQTARGDDSFKTFASFFENETDGYARRIAAEVATSMPATKAQNAWMAEQVFLETDAVIQTKYTRVLGDNSKRVPENETVLRKMLETVDDKEVRKTIYRYISPVPRGGAK